MLATQNGLSKPTLISLRRWRIGDSLVEVMVKLRRAFLSLLVFCFKRNHKSPFYGVCADARNSNYFVATVEAGGNGNGGTRYFQKFREKTDTGIICSAVDGRSGDLQLESISE